MPDRPVESDLPAWIGLGANLGDRRGSLEAAVAAIDRLPETRVDQVSTFIETPPVGPIEQPTYLNGVVRIRTTIDAVSLLGCLLTIERRHGRDRSRESRWGPRTLDLDLLMYHDFVLASDDLTIPHPRMHERLFVLAPLAEIDPDLMIPGRGAPVAQLAASLSSTAS
ncbi:MAG: 2-amino-4-hydroxy-6-hydroxymethyldihydropteridine diphosphokinase [Phycisphaerae bacterium]|nr:2-amino-4-hydroxy-6-hydroxymethyldihydropteridine diphosphokinase [Phycisphaerae bacterium]|tara:strand:- start:68 stop:568 length:501 start_codon:yes stop_codon:yes gene_type:complete